MTNPRKYSKIHKTSPTAPTLTNEKGTDKKDMPWWASLLLALLLLAAGAGTAVGYYTMQQLSPVMEVRSDMVTFEVLPGWSASQVARELEDAGLIRSAQVFALWLRFNDLDRSIGEGLYDLNAGMSLPDIARRLAEGGRPRTVRVVIPEGFRMIDVAERLAEAGFGSNKQFLALFSNPDEIRPEFVPEDAPLEGYLFPASYDIPLSSTPEAITRLMLERFEAELTPETRTRLEQLDWTVHEWTTFASMIQSEAGDSSEMTIIAGVFRNRLDEGWRLESDPTVAYGLGKDLPELDFPAGDFSVDHPWNTYMHTGLPPTPISNPGSDALAAVFVPTRQNEDGQDYFFFLHAPDGTFRPNLNLQDHERDVQRYLR
jgi:UPF0755 protein